MIPYSRQTIDKDDIEAVIEVLKSDWLTTGPKVEEFEKAVCGFTGAAHAVAVSSGTAALHAAMFAAGIGPGDEVIVPAMTFAATANCVVYQGGTPVFADVETDTLLTDAAAVRAKISRRTKAVIAVDYAGQPCNYDELSKIADGHGLLLVSDACHSIGGSFKGRRVGTLADMTVFSFHPVKHITTGEGGMIMTDREEFTTKMQQFRNHGITTDHRQRQQQGSWFYEMVDLGYNYRITDFQCALGLSQLGKLEKWIMQRRQIGEYYDKAFSAHPYIRPLRVAENVRHAYHLYVVRIDEKSPVNRNDIFAALRSREIGVNVHYSPVYLHPFYRKTFGYAPGLCPTAEREASQILSLPMYAALSESLQEKVVKALFEILPAS